MKWIILTFLTLFSFSSLANSADDILDVADELLAQEKMGPMRKSKKLKKKNRDSFDRFENGQYLKSKRFEKYQKRNEQKKSFVISTNAVDLSQGHANVKLDFSAEDSAWAFNIFGTRMEEEIESLKVQATIYGMGFDYSFSGLALTNSLYLGGQFGFIDIEYKGRVESGDLIELIGTFNLKSSGEIDGAATRPFYGMNGGYRFFLGALAINLHAGFYGTALANSTLNESSEQTNNQANQGVKVEALKSVLIPFAGVDLGLGF